MHQHADGHDQWAARCIHCSGCIEGHEKTVFLTYLLCLRHVRARSNIARWPPHLQQPMALGLRVTHSLWLRLLVPTSFTWTTSKYTPRALLIPRRDCATA